MADLVAALGAFSLSVAGIALIVYVPSLRRRAIVEPTGDRWHDKATPSVAGIPMFLAWLVTVLVANGTSADRTRGILVGAGLIFLVGVLDDIRGLSPAMKFLGQLLSATTAVLMGAVSEVASAPGVDEFTSILWIILIANAVNLLDNMDGLAGGIVMIVAVTGLSAANQAGSGDLRMLLAALIGCLMGFLFFNIHPARVFMGDSGSLWLGLVVAAASLPGIVTIDGLNEASWWLWLLPLTLLAVPLLDTNVVSIDRRKRRRPITQGGKDHVSHRLVSLGLSQRQAVTVIWALGVICGLAALSMIHWPLVVWRPLLALVWIGLVVVVAGLLGIAEPDRPSVASAPKSEGSA